MIYKMYLFLKTFLFSFQKFSTEKLSYRLALRNRKQLCEDNWQEDTHVTKSHDISPLAIE